MLLRPSRAAVELHPLGTRPSARESCWMADFVLPTAEASRVSSGLCAWSPDGLYFASVSDRDVRVFDGETLRVCSAVRRQL